MLNPEKSFYLVKTLFLFFDRKKSLAKQIFTYSKIAAVLRPVSFELQNPLCYPFKQRL